VDPTASAASVATGAAAPSRLSRYRFVALGVVWSAYLVVFLSRLCVGPLAPFLKSAFDLDNAQIGGLTSATAVAYAPTLIFAGWQISGTEPSPGPRPRSSLDSPPLGSSRDGAHQATTCACARVSAT